VWVRVSAVPYYMFMIVVMGRVMDDDDAVPVPVLYCICSVPVGACVRRRGYGGARRGTSECGWGLPTVMLIRLRVVVARTVQLKASRTAITVTDRQHQRFRSFIIIIDSTWWWKRTRPARVLCNHFVLSAAAINAAMACVRDSGDGVPVQLVFVRCSFVFAGSGS